MFSPPVPTGIVPPVQPDRLLRRARLINLIDSPYPARVTEIVAGAGFGKSTLAWQWATNSDRLVSWISLRPVDDDAVHFLQRLATAGHLTDSSTILPAVPVVDRHVPTAAIESLLDRFAAAPEHICIVLDNCQVLRSTEMQTVLNIVVSQMPDSMSLLLLSRRPLALRLSRLRSQGQVRDITASDLRFTVDEVSAAMELLAPGAASPHCVDRLWAASGGWGAGLAFATSSHWPPLPNGAAVDELRRVHERFLDEYILEEVLEPLPGDVRDLALAAGDLPFITPRLCDAILESNDGDRQVSRLVREIPFLVPHQSRSGAYVLTPPFSASVARLLDSLPKDETRSARRTRATKWLLGEGELSYAADLAMESNDEQFIADILSAVCRHFADRSDLASLARWLERLPRHTARLNLSLPYWWIVSRLGLGQTSGVGDLIDEIEPRWMTSGDPLHIGRAHLSRGMLAYYTGDARESDRRLTKALERLPDDALAERMYATTYLGRSAIRFGRDEAAVKVLAETVAYAAHLPLDEQWSWRVIAPDRANTYAIRGDVRSAITKYKLMLSELPDYLASLAGFLHCRLVGLHLERNDFESAGRELEAAESAMGEVPDTWHYDVAVAKARLLLASGDSVAAESWASSYVKRLRRMPQKPQMVLILAQIWLARKEFPLVRSWLEDIQSLEYPWINTFGDLNHRLMAIELDLAEGDVERAAQIGQQYAAEAAATLRWSEHIAFSVRWAVALDRLGKFHQAREVFASALDRGVAGGFVRHFQVPGVDIARVFADVWSASPEFLRIKQAIDHPPRPRSAANPAGLTRREIEVLRLVGRGRSNQQIADLMYISINTVRNHLVNICRRLDASSRLEAVAKAREMSILD